MKRIVWFALALVVALGAMQPVEAKKQEDQEFRRVIVTLKSGEKIDGYLTAMWTPDRGLKLKKPNYSFKLALTPDGKRSDSAKYTADEVASIDRGAASRANTLHLSVENILIGCPVCIRPRDAAASAARSGAAEFRRVCSRATTLHLPVRNILIKAVLCLHSAKNAAASAAQSGAAEFRGADRYAVSRPYAPAPVRTRTRSTAACVG